jgi:peptidylprolyl isomerase
MKIMIKNTQGSGLVKALLVMILGAGGVVGYLKWKKLKDEEAERSRPVSFAQKFETALQQLQSTDLVVGSGKEANRGEKVTIHYVGKLPDGTVFDSSRSRNQPVSFPLGVAQALPGWDHGIVGMKVGGKRKIEVPPFLAYGETGVAGLVPPDTTVIFEIELLKVGVADDPITKKNIEIEKKAAAEAKLAEAARLKKALQARKNAPPVPVKAKPAKSSKPQAIAKPQKASKSAPASKPSPSPKPKKKKK